MNEALVHWLMAPDAPEPVSLEDFLGRPEWHQRVLCRGETALYFSGATESVEKAMAICRTCPVREPCHTTAMSDPDLEGVWGGFTARERREMRRQVALSLATEPRSRNRGSSRAQPLVANSGLTPLGH